VGDNDHAWSVLTVWAAASIATETNLKKFGSDQLDFL
jgi:hypothetical protein